MPARRSITIGNRNEHNLEVVEITTKRRDSGKLVTILVCKCLAGLTDDCKRQVEVEQPNFARTKACGPCVGSTRGRAVQPITLPKVTRRVQTQEQRADAERKAREREQVKLEDARYAAYLADLDGLGAPPHGLRYQLAITEHGQPTVVLEAKPSTPGVCDNPNCDRCKDLGNFDTVRRRFAEFQDEFMDAGRDAEAYEEICNHPETRFWEQKRAEARARFALARERDRNAF